MSIKRKHLRTGLILTAVIAGLYLTGLYNYLLFHSLIEVFSVVIAASIFLVAWNARNYLENAYLLFLGVAYFFIAGLDLLHALAYKGIGIFTDYDYYANQLWISARYMEAASFVIATVFISGRRSFSPYAVFSIYTVIFSLVVASVFWWKNFPVCYIEGVGQTTFKVFSEYMIALLLLFGLIVMNRQKEAFDRKVFRLVAWSIVVTILSELSFALYVSIDGHIIMIAHYLKALSFYFIYKAIVETAFAQPISLLFKELKQNEVKLKNLNVTKDKFFSIIAHDLKSPFNSLIGFSELLLNNYEVFSDEERKRLFTLINNSSKKAHNLLNNLLQWSRAQTGMLQNNPERFNVVDLVKDNMELLQTSAKEKDIELQCGDEEEYVFADKNMINTVIRNLMNNAIKFTPEGGKVAISCMRKSEAVSVTVADSGIGISAEDREKLFRLDKLNTMSSAPKEKGSGLGLIICKEFIEKNQGELQVKSEPGKGSRFTFTLPAADPRPEA